jgi:hypothetical protein
MGILALYFNLRNFSSKTYCALMIFLCLTCPISNGINLYVESVQVTGGKARRKGSLRRPSCTSVNNIKILERKDRVVWTGLDWLRIGTSGWPL